MAPTTGETGLGLRSGDNGAGNPFANDYTLMTLSLWWVQRTRPLSTDFDKEVAATIASLARDVR
jgi:hypothetical protein